MKTYTIGNKNLPILTQLGFDIIELPYLQDKEIHDFVLTKLVSLEAEKFVIHISADNNLGLQLGLHIRLTPELGKSKNSALIFVANESFLTIMKSSGRFSQILITQGCYFEKLGPNLIEKIKIAQPLKDEAYFYDFYNKINIKADEDFGKHSIANEWGAIRFAEITGNTEILNTDIILKNIKKTLYYKYLNSTNIDDLSIISQKNKIDNSQRKILFIDDEGRKGWNLILKAIFSHPENVTTVELLESELFISFYQRAKEEALKKDLNGYPLWDLILLDLRLNPNEDIGKNSNKLASQYSGAKLLSEIKDSNEGIQVIMFTASNKAWNMRELQEMRANGFYIKESPEYNRNISFSEKNYTSFERQIKDCLRMHFVRKFHEKTNKIEKSIKHISVDDNIEFNSFLANLKSKIRIIRVALSSVDINRSITLDVVFLSFFNFLESFDDHYIREDSYNYYIGEESIDINRYYIQNNQVKKEIFTRKSNNDSPSFFVGLAALFIDYFKVDSYPYPETKKLKKIADMRNDYIHSAKENFSIEDITTIIDITIIACSNIKE